MVNREWLKCCGKIITDILKRNDFKDLDEAELFSAMTSHSSFADLKLSCEEFSKYSKEMLNAAKNIRILFVDFKNMVDNLPEGEFAQATIKNGSIELEELDVSKWEKEEDK